MKHRKIWLIGAIALSLIVATAFKRKYVNPVKQDLEQYASRTHAALMVRDEAIITAYQEATKNGYRENLALRDTLRDELIPDMLDLLEYVDENRPVTDELQEVHGHIRTAFEAQLEAFNVLFELIETREHGLITVCNELLGHVKEEKASYNESLGELASRYDVELPDLESLLRDID